MEKCNFRIEYFDNWESRKKVTDARCSMGVSFKDSNRGRQYETKCDPEKCVVWQNHIMLQKLLNK